MSRRKTPQANRRNSRGYILVISTLLLALALLAFASEGVSADGLPAGLSRLARWIFQTPTISGVQINLIRTSDGYTTGIGDVVTSTVTASDGSWNFGYLVGTWKVQVDASNFLPGHALYGKVMTGSACGITTDNSCTLTVLGAALRTHFMFGLPPPAYGGPFRVDRQNANAIEVWNGSGIALYAGNRADPTVRLNGSGAITNTGTLDIGAFEQVTPRPVITVTNNSVFTPTGTLQPITSQSIVTTATLTSDLMQFETRVPATPVPLATPACAYSMFPEDYPGYCALSYPGTTALTRTFTLNLHWASKLVLENVGAYAITVVYPSVTMQMLYGSAVRAFTMATLTLQPGEAHELWYDYGIWLDPS